MDIGSISTLTQQLSSSNLCFHVIAAPCSKGQETNSFSLTYFFSQAILAIWRAVGLSKRSVCLSMQLIDKEKKKGLIGADETTVFVKDKLFDKCPSCCVTHAAVTPKWMTLHLNYFVHIFSNHISIICIYLSIYPSGSLRYSAPHDIIQTEIWRQHSNQEEKFTYITQHSYLFILTTCLFVTNNA